MSKLVDPGKDAASPAEAQQARLIAWQRPLLKQDIDALRATRVTDAIALMPVAKAEGEQVNERLPRLP
jgi:hypothetical protein